MFPGHKIIPATATKITVKYIPSHNKTHKL